MMALDKRNMQKVGTLEEMLKHPLLPRALERLAKLRGNPDVVRALASLFTERESRLIENCKVYAASDPAGLPGHNLMVLIDKLDSLAGWLIERCDTAELAELVDVLHGLSEGDG